MRDPFGVALKLLADEDSGDQIDIKGLVQNRNDYTSESRTG